jgi:hypothetical protein
MSDPSRKLRRKACKTKVKFYSERDAGISCRTYRVKYGENLEPYHCKICGWWHIGHSRDFSYQRIDAALKRAGGKK